MTSEALVNPGLAHAIDVSNHYLSPEQINVTSYNPYDPAECVRYWANTNPVRIHTRHYDLIIFPWEHRAGDPTYVTVIPNTRFLGLFWRTSDGIRRAAEDLSWDNELVGNTYHIERTGLTPFTGLEGHMVPRYGNRLPRTSGFSLN